MERWETAHTEDELEGVTEERLGALHARRLLGVAGDTDLHRGRGLENAALVPGLVRQVVSLAPSHVQHPALQVKNRLHQKNRGCMPPPDDTRTATGGGCSELIGPWRVQP